MKCLLVLLVAFFATGEAMKCYECIKEAGCNDPFDKDNSAVKAIDYESGCLCAKEVIETTAKTLTTRTCVQMNVPQQIATRAESPSLVSYSLSLCNTDLCNGANSITATHISLMILAVLLMFAVWQ